jgi:hypothetical protein
MTELSIEPFANVHLDGLVALVVAEGWSEYAVDVERTSRALSAPGVTTLRRLARAARLAFASCASTSGSEPPILLRRGEACRQ